MGIANIISLFESNLNNLELMHLTNTGDASVGYKIMKTSNVAMNHVNFLTELHAMVTRIWHQI